MAGAGVHSGADSGEGALLQRAGLRVHAELQSGPPLDPIILQVTRLPNCSKSEIGLGNLTFDLKGRSPPCSEPGYEGSQVRPSIPNILQVASLPPIQIRKTRVL